MEKKKNDNKLNLSFSHIKEPATDNNFGGYNILSLLECVYTYVILFMVFRQYVLSTGGDCQPFSPVCVTVYSFILCYTNGVIDDFLTDPLRKITRENQIVYLRFPPPIVIGTTVVSLPPN